MSCLQLIQISTQLRVSVRVGVRKVHWFSRLESIAESQCAVSAGTVWIQLKIVSAIENIAATSNPNTIEAALDKHLHTFAVEAAGFHEIDDVEGSRNCQSTSIANFEVEPLCVAAGVNITAQ